MAKIADLITLSFFNSFTKRCSYSPELPLRNEMGLRPNKPSEFKVFKSDASNTFRKFT